MDNRLVLGKLHIVEWLNENDRRTGRELFEDIEPLGKTSEPPVEVVYHSIATAGELLGLLQAIGEDYRRDRRTPLLHLETHGANDGIEARGEAFAWRDLAGVLVPLNRLTGLNLVVVLAACEGFYGTAMLRPKFGQAPFRGLIGPNREVSDRELLQGAVAFYRTIFRRLDGDQALRAMNDIVDPANETFWHISAETIFMLAYRNYLETQGSPEAIASRADGIAQRVALRRSAARRYRLKRPKPCVGKRRPLWRIMTLTSPSSAGGSFSSTSFRRMVDASTLRSMTAGPVGAARYQNSRPFEVGMYAGNRCVRSADDAIL